MIKCINENCKHYNKDSEDNSNCLQYYDLRKCIDKNRKIVEFVRKS